MKVLRRGSMSTAQFRAIARGLEFDREKRTPSVGRFMEEFTAGTGIRRDHMAAAGPHPDKCSFLERGGQ
jgi:hypothetical protein